MIDSWLQTGPENASLIKWLDVIAEEDLPEVFGEDFTCKFLKSLDFRNLQAKHVKLVKHLISVCKDHENTFLFVQANVKRGDIFTEIVELIMLLPEKCQVVLAAECMKLEGAGNRMAQFLLSLSKDSNFTLFFDLFFLEIPSREKYDALRIFINGLKMSKLWNANDQFISFLSKNPKCLEFEEVYSILNLVINLKPVTVDIQDLLLSIAKHNALFDGGYIREEGLCGSSLHTFGPTLRPNYQPK